jgi:hypothetical protein
MLRSTSMTRICLSNAATAASWTDGKMFLHAEFSHSKPTGS